MSLGDVDGTGRLAVVLVAKIASTDRQHVDRPDRHEVVEFRLYALDAITGDDLLHFPVVLTDESSSISSITSMPQPLLVDLHEDQQHWLDQIRGMKIESVDAIREINVAAAKQRGKESSQPRPHGGSGRGLHIGESLMRRGYFFLFKRNLLISCIPH
jgi:hypothetical protein